MEAEDWKRAITQYLQSLSAAGLSVVPRTPDPMLKSIFESVGNEAVAADSRAAAHPASNRGKSDSLSDVEVAGSTAPANRSEGIPAATPSLAMASSEAPAEARLAYPPALPVIERQLHLDELAAEVSRCERCPELAKRRHLTVFSDGPSDARICFFGEAPGADEDRIGRPFVGAAGQLLDKMIAACTMERRNVYILNTLKCRPPGNRNPNDNELENCRGYWVKQLELVRPEFIVCLGTFAVRSLLGGQQSIGKLRGRIHRYRDSQVVVTYHPSYLLRNESAKKMAWEDLKMLMAALGIQPPSRRT